jgi:hypothetical protein
MTDEATEKSLQRSPSSDVLNKLELALQQIRGESDAVAAFTQLIKNLQDEQAGTNKILSSLKDAVENWSDEDSGLRALMQLAIGQLETLADQQVQILYRLDVLLGRLPARIDWTDVIKTFAAKGGPVITALAGAAAAWFGRGMLD